MPKILVADDEPNIREVITRLLSNEGYEVIEAVDGRWAYTKAVSERPDIVLLDITMPVMSGLLVLHKLKNNPQTESIPVIILTSSHFPRHELEGMQMGALDYITKPWGPGELEDRVRLGLTYLESGKRRAPPDSFSPPNPADGGSKAQFNLRSEPQSTASGSSKRQRPPTNRRAGSPIQDRRASSTARGDATQSATQDSRRQRDDREKVAKAFIQEKYQRIREIKFTRVTEIGPIAGLNVYKLEGITTVLLGDIPTLQAKGFYLTIKITRDGRVVDRQGRVL